MNASRCLLLIALLLGTGTSARLHAANERESTAPPSTVQPGKVVDLNTADIPTLEQIPEIGTDLANAVVAARPFKSIEDVQRALKLAPEQMQTLRAKVTLSPVKPTASTPPDPRASSGPSKPSTVNDGKAVSHQKVTERYDRAAKQQSKK